MSWGRWEKEEDVVIFTQEQLTNAVSGILNEWGYYHFSGHVSERFEGDNVPTLMFALEHPANSHRVKQVGRVLVRLVEEVCPLTTRVWYDQGVFYVSPA